MGEEGRFSAGVPEGAELNRSRRDPKGHEKLELEFIFQSSTSEASAPKRLSWIFEGAVFEVGFTQTPWLEAPEVLLGTRI